MKQGKAGYPVTEAILHCAAVPSGWYLQIRDWQIVPIIREWHKRRGWRDIGYHYVIPPNGAILTGRPADQIGAGVQGHNRGVLHILMIEKSEIKQVGKFHDFYTEKQRDAVRGLVRTFAIGKVTGHNEYAPKLCPGFKVKQEFFL